MVYKNMNEFEDSAVSSEVISHYAGKSYTFGSSGGKEPKKNIWKYIIAGMIGILGLSYVAATWYIHTLELQTKAQIELTKELKSIKLHIEAANDLTKSLNEDDKAALEDFNFLAKRQAMKGHEGDEAFQERVNKIEHTFSTVVYSHDRLERELEKQKRMNEESAQALHATGLILEQSSRAIGDALDGVNSKQKDIKDSVLLVLDRQSKTHEKIDNLAENMKSRKSRAEVPSTNNNAKNTSSGGDNVKTSSGGDNVKTSSGSSNNNTTTGAFDKFNELLEDIRNKNSAKTKRRTKDYTTEEIYAMDMRYGSDSFVEDDDDVLDGIGIEKGFRGMNKAMFNAQADIRATASSFNKKK